MQSSASMAELRKGHVQAGAPPLPCMTDAPEGTVFDLWSAHAQSGATDESQVRPNIARTSSEEC